MSEVVLGFTDMQAGIARRIEDAERAGTLSAWTLYVRRGRVAPHLEADGLVVAVRTSTTGPLPPYLCYLVLEFAGSPPAGYEAHPERDHHAVAATLRMEATTVGAFNIVRSVSGAGPIAARLSPAFWA